MPYTVFLKYTLLYHTLNCVRFLSRFNSCGNHLVSPHSFLLHNVVLCTVCEFVPRVLFRKCAGMDGEKREGPKKAGQKLRQKKKDRNEAK